MDIVTRSVVVTWFVAIAAQCAWASSPLRISGGSMALPGQFRYLAVVQPLDGSGSGQPASLCSGALIDPQWVLTSASCIKDAATFKVTLGAFDLTLASEETRQTFTVTNKMIHEGYKSGNENDLGLLQLGESAVEDEFVAPILLPSKQQVSKSFSFWLGSVAGWGDIKKGDHTAGNWVLRWFDSRVVPNFWCKFRNGAKLVRDTNICVSTFFWKKGTCVGDAGSPLAALEKDDTPVLLGIASDDAASCGNWKPAVFTRIASYLDWISAATSIPLRG